MFLTNRCNEFTFFFLVLGDPRSNQNPALLAFGIVFFRWHNEVAKQIQEEHPDWSDEDIFQRARRWVIASLQVSAARFSFALFYSAASALALRILQNVRFCESLTAQTKEEEMQIELH
ncbi:Dual oxidase [Araneus ventricosus]|uniref:Dual oxidase n=1 Tax=Araneus ventricosus TaxID=182803 RepID=A0A4Y2V6Z4_ARAVE|nr:Dual oxidase [Araneus ventricosus]GBO19846.1 Dual oxidase [Araneus ventricosus]GBO19861.1 Dual oxidase [Araneus ventricosus]GBO19884.1 Dual oxidase [Araneus ventricosus]